MYSGNSGREWVWGKSTTNQFQRFHAARNDTWRIDTARFNSTVAHFQVSSYVHLPPTCAPTQNPIYTLYYTAWMTYNTHNTPFGLSTPIILKSAAWNTVRLSWCHDVSLFSYLPLLPFSQALNETHSPTQLAAISYHSILHMGQFTNYKVRASTLHTRVRITERNGVHTSDRHETWYFVDLLVDQLIFSLISFSSSAFPVIPTHPSVTNHYCRLKRKRTLSTFP